MRSHKANAAVISVGNITAGGTGKTPLVIWLCNYLSEKSLSCAILTRGYKSTPGKLTDEPAILAKSCPDARVVINADRVAGAQKATLEKAFDVLVMDDGFQHRKLGRDLDILTIDATCPFGFGHLLPAGLLREPAKNIKRSDIVVITRSNQVAGSVMDELEWTLKKIASEIPVAKTIFRHPGAMGMKGQSMTMNELRSGKVFVFCGIGNPDAFTGQLARCGMTVVGSRLYNDHHNYTSRDMKDIYEEAKYLGADTVVTTQKDWVKAALLIKDVDDITFVYLKLELEFIAGYDKMEELLMKTCPHKDENPGAGQRSN
jgi:tetraacyldisaccharide 4'-kinase